MVTLGSFCLDCAKRMEGHIEEKEVAKGVERGHSRAPVGFAGVLVVVLLFLAQGQAAEAATITVNTNDDELDTDGDCSLREAIQAANTDAAVDNCTAGSGADTIIVPAGIYVLSIAGAGEDLNETGDLDITSAVTINGAGAATTVIDGADLDRVFHTDPLGSGVTVVITDVTVRNGFAPPFVDLGGGIFNGGPFVSGGTLTLDRVIVTMNTSTSVGGGIANNGGTLNLNSSAVIGNTGGRSGGGIWTNGTVTLNHSTVSGNTAGGFAGGGIANFGMLTLNRSTVSGNSAGEGGGIDNNRGTVSVAHSTISTNSAVFRGGGINNFAPSDAPNVATVTLTNSTVSGNSVEGSGGGIFSNLGIVTINSSTVSGNSAFLSGGINNQFGSTNLKNTIVANNSGGDCSVTSITSAGHNLIEDTSGGCAISGDLIGNIIGSDPLLGPLTDNGGPTQTHALLPGSPAIDAGSTDCPPPATDQRGFARPVDGDGDSTATCDIGAYEFGATSTITVDMDIKPGSFPNSINLRSKGKIPVAILSSATFDATTQVNQGTLTFGHTGDEASLAFCNPAGEDVNGDSLLDLVCHFHTQTAAFESGDTQGILKGQMVSGMPIIGTDSVRIVPPE